MQTVLPFVRRLAGFIAVLWLSTTATLAQDPGVAIPAATNSDDHKIGSILVYNFFTSGAVSGNAQNTNLNVTNTHPDDAVRVRLFFIRASGLVNDLFLTEVGPNETVHLLASDFLPGVSGYAIAVAVDADTGCPVSFNHLAGDADVKLTSGHHTGLAAVAISALYNGVLAGCNAMSPSAALMLDGTSYNKVPDTVALDNFPSRADGNDTLLVLNRLSGDLGSEIPPIGMAGGTLFDDATNESGFSFEPTEAQFRQSLSNPFPQTLPSFETIIPAGRSGWMTMSQQSDPGWSGAMINFNANSNAAANAFNGGHNLHAITFTSNTLNMPVGQPSTAADVSIRKSHLGNLVPNTTTSYFIEVSNNILRDTITAQIVVSDTLPADLTLVGFDGTGWSCGTLGTPNVSCTNDTDLPAGESLPTLELIVEVGAGTPVGTNTVTNTASVSIAPQMEEPPGNNSNSETSTVICPDCIPAAANAAMDGGKTGSVLVYNFFTSGAVSGNAQNTNLNVTNTHPDDAVRVRVFFVRASGLVNDLFLTEVGPNETVHLLASDFLPGVSGYAIAVAVDADTGCPVGFNHLAGDADVKLTSGHHTGLAAVAISALYNGVLAGCNAMSPSATLMLDGTSYNKVPDTVALDNFPSRADGNDTLLVLNRLSGDLGSEIPPIGMAGGTLFDDATNESGFSFEPTEAQFRQSLSNPFPQTLPSFETIIPAGRSGWMTMSQQSDPGWSGAMINFNANSNAAANAFNGGHNLHAITFTSNTLTMPVGQPSTVADVAIRKSHPGNLVPNTTTSYFIEVSNNILRDTITAQIAVSDTLPADLTLIGFDGVGWSCGTLGTPNVTCTNDTDLPAGESLATLELIVEVGAGTPVGTDTVTNTASVSVAPQMEEPLGNNSNSETSTVICPDCIPAPANAAMDDGKTASVLVYNFFTSGAVSGNAQNSRLSVTNTDADDGVAVRLFLIDGTTGTATSLVEALGPNETASWLTSEIAAGVTGYALAVAVDINSGCPISFNHLAGDVDVKLASGHRTGLSAVAVSALYDGMLPGCNAMSTSAALLFNDAVYNRVPSQLALDNIASRADGNDTLLVLNQLSGDLGAMMDDIGAASMEIFNDVIQSFPFSFNSTEPQLRESLSNAFPGSDFETIVPAGRSAWLHTTQNDNAGWSGAAINFNANSSAAANAFIGGHNLHTLASSTTNTLMMPVEPCDPPVVNPAVLSPSTVLIGEPYSQMFSATGGMGTVVLNLEGTPPPGLTFAGDTLSGTPNDSGTFTFTITATDELGCIGSREYTLVVDDNDDVPTTIEDGAPNNGDGNGDGIPDSNQPDVASRPSATCDGYITVVAVGAGGCGKLMNVTTVSEAALGVDTEFNYPFGLVGFTLDCAASSMITVFFHCDSEANPDAYRKYGPEAPAFGAPHYYTLPGAVFGTAKVPPVTGPDVLTASFTLTNGLIGDGTPAADEMIVDPGGPADRLHFPIPAASTAGIVALVAALLLLAMWRLRHRTSP